MTTPQEQSLPTNRQPTAFERLSQPPQLYGVAAVTMLGLASFFFMLTYLGRAEAPAAAHAAAVAGAVENSFADMDIDAESAIVYDLATGRVLYEKNADAQLPLASIAKVMLALAVSEVLSPTTVITIPYDTAPTGSSERLAAGESWQVRDVINFTLIVSSNEGADILAQAAHQPIRATFAAAPRENATIWRMNEIAREIGMHHSYFLNASGLDISTTQSGAYASARDVARLMAFAATSSPGVFTGTAENGILLASEEGTITSALNTNEALGDIPGLMMGKTGYTDLAGGNLAVVFDVGLAHPVVAVVLGSSRDGRFTDMKTLVARAREAVTRE